MMRRVRSLSPHDRGDGDLLPVSRTSSLAPPRGKKTRIAGHAALAVVAVFGIYALLTLSRMGARPHHKQVLGFEHETWAQRGQHAWNAGAQEWDHAGGSGGHGDWADPHGHAHGLGHDAHWNDGHAGGHAGHAAADEHDHHMWGHHMDASHDWEDAHNAHGHDWHHDAHADAHVQRQAREWEEQQHRQEQQHGHGRQEHDWHGDAHQQHLDSHGHDHHQQQAQAQHQQHQQQHQQHHQQQQPEHPDAWWDDSHVRYATGGHHDAHHAHWDAAADAHRAADRGHEQHYDAAHGDHGHADGHYYHHGGAEDGHDSFWHDAHDRGAPDGGHGANHPGGWERDEHGHVFHDAEGRGYTADEAARVLEHEAELQWHIENNPLPEPEEDEAHHVEHTHPHFLHHPDHARPQGLYTLSAVDIDGRPRSLSEFAGRVTLVVNVASHCSLTDSNYRGLKAVYDKYGPHGLEILAFPTNNFGNQEPGSNRDIKAFAQKHYNVTFPMFEKIDVNDPNTHPVYSFLKRELPVSENGGGGHGPGRDLPWNFMKVLVDQRGRPVRMVSQAWDQAEVENAVYDLLLSGELEYDSWLQEQRAHAHAAAHGYDRDAAGGHDADGAHAHGGQEHAGEAAGHGAHDEWAHHDAHRGHDGWAHHDTHGAREQQHGSAHGEVFGDVADPWAHGGHDGSHGDRGHAAHWDAHAHGQPQQQRQQQQQQQHRYEQQQRHEQQQHHHHQQQRRSDDQWHGHDQAYHQ